MSSTELVTIAERPELAQAAFAIPYAGDDGSFMQGNQAASLVAGSRLISRWSDHTLVLLDSDLGPIARGVMVPFAAAAEGRQRFPDGGWDQIAIWAAEDALDARAVDTLCALEIAVHPDHRGRQRSATVLAGMRQVALVAGLALVAPVRPPDKAAEPHVPMAEYAARCRPDGLPTDRWLRVHRRAGGVIQGVAHCSGTVQAPLGRWREWTGLPLDRDGPVAVPGGLVPLLVDLTHDVGVYVEPNVWVRHVP
jgi:GNAT superfamily N-acetyltransferase